MFDRFCRSGEACLVIRPQASALHNAHTPKLDVYFVATKVFISVLDDNSHLAVLPSAQHGALQMSSIRVENVSSRPRTTVYSLYGSFQRM